MRDDRNYTALLQAGLVLFWASYFSIVVITNVFDGLKGLGVLAPEWKFASGNWQLMVSVTKLYGTPTGVTALLFVGVVAWEVLGAALLWQSLAARDTPGFSAAATRGFTIIIALSAAFLLADEIFLAYSVAGTHIHLLIAQIVSWMVVTRNA